MVLHMTTAAHTHRPDFSAADTTVCFRCGGKMADLIAAQAAYSASRPAARNRKAEAADPMAATIREIDNERRRARRRAGY